MGRARSRFSREHRFEVDDIEGEVRKLRTKGVVVEDIFETPVCQQTWFSDPEGNKVSIHQKNAGR
jgi:predicted enzyme related to lactoylglutathione lyase